MKILLTELIDSHKFFVRKSQHYILGNWSIYVPFRKKINYYWNYPKAYLKFMYLTFKDCIKNKVTNERRGL